MKRSKRKVVVLALLICLLTLISTAGSLAWFSAKDNAQNKFMVATSDETTDPDDIFSVDVWEQYDSNGDGDFNEADDKDYADSLEYEAILPGDRLSKVVNVENTGAYDQYIRVTVTISDAQAWMAFAAANPTFSITEVFVGFDAAKWTHIWNNMNTADPDFDPNATEIVYCLYYKDVLAAGDVLTVFEAVKIPELLTQEQAAQRVGKSRSAVANAMRLLQLNEEIRSLVEREEISAGHARALLTLPPHLQDEAVQTILASDLSVRQTEQLVKRLQNKPEKEETSESADPLAVDYVAEAERSLSGKLGRACRIAHGKKKGRVEIEYYGVDDLNDLLDALGKLGM